VLPFGFQKLPVGSSVLCYDINDFKNYIVVVFFYIVYLKGSIFCTLIFQKKMHNVLLFFLLLECIIYSLCASPDENKLYLFKNKKYN